MPSRTWPAPEKREISIVSDLSILADVLIAVTEQPNASAELVNRSLAPRLTAQRQVEKIGPATIRGVLEELRHYGWLIRSADTDEKRVYRYSPTSEGKAAARLAEERGRPFLSLLTAQTQKIYAIPGWMVSRLWQINPNSGEVILPAPKVGWEASASARSAEAWGRELEGLAAETRELARSASVEAFPVTEADWISAVARGWRHVHGRKRKDEKPRDDFPWSRAGMALAMRMASLQLLFAPRPYGLDSEDILAERPLSVKTFKPWCPRLQAMELLGYTDAQPGVCGRLLYPTSVFRSNAPGSHYTRAEGICNPDGLALYLHRPLWVQLRDRFLVTLLEAYQLATKRVLARYVSLIDVRDEVCRRLRLSPLTFEEYLSTLLDESLQSGGWQISVETDALEDQRAGGQARRPVYINGIQHTLVAMSQTMVAAPRTS